MKLDLFLNTLTILEIIAVEFISIWVLSKKKRRLAAVLGMYLAITAILLVFMLFIAVHMEDYGNGSGQFMHLGAFYFIPAFWGFGGDWKSRTIIAFYSFSYGLAGFALAVRFGYLFPESSLDVTVFLIQTALYAVSLPLFLKFSKGKVVVYLEKAGAQQKNILIRYTISSFILIIAYNRIMTMDAGAGRKLLIYMLLIYFVILAYSLMVSYLKADDDVHELSEMVLVDKLTGVGNRAAFFSAANHWIKNGRPFYLFFLDLDNFKSINDRYGHSAGDEYLIGFAFALKALEDDETEVFRIAGDEFICISYDKSKREYLENIQVNYTNELFQRENIKFLGVSVGQAYFPDDAVLLPELLSKADKKMYNEKYQRKAGAQHKKA